METVRQNSVPSKLACCRPPPPRVERRQVSPLFVILIARKHRWRTTWAASCTPTLGTRACIPSGLLMSSLGRPVGFSVAGDLADMRVRFVASVQRRIRPDGMSSNSAIALVSSMNISADIHLRFELPSTLCTYTARPSVATWYSSILNIYR